MKSAFRAALFTWIFLAACRFGTAEGRAQPADSGNPAAGIARHYVSELVSMISGRIRTAPCMAEQGNTAGSGRVLIRVTLNRAGSMVSGSIARSSGNEACDIQLLGLVLMSGPFPPVPPELPGKDLNFLLPIQMRVGSAPDKAR